MKAWTPKSLPTDNSTRDCLIDDDKGGALNSSNGKMARNPLEMVSLGAGMKSILRCIEYGVYYQSRRRLNDNRQQCASNGQFSVKASQTLLLLGINVKNCTTETWTRPTRKSHETHLQWGVRLKANGKNCAWNDQYGVKASNSRSIGEIMANRGTTPEIARKRMQRVKRSITARNFPMGSRTPPTGKPHETHLKWNLF